MGFQVPAGFQGTSIKLQAAEKLDGTYLDVYDSAGSQLSITTAAGRTTLVPASSPARFLRFVKLVVAAQNASVTVRVLRKQGA